MHRRRFIATTTAATGGLILGIPFSGSFAEKGQADLVLVRNGNPAAMVRKAFELLGGAGRFIQPGQTVVVKPNMSWDRAPEYGANNHPETAAEVARICLEAGAKKVLAFDNSCQEARRCYINSGVERAMSDAGADVRFIRDRLFETVEIPGGSKLKKWDFYLDALEADVLINLPVLKHHSLSRLTIGLKNMMGLLGGNRGSIHTGFNEKIVDVNRVLRPQLTIVDAIRVLRRNGPSGGNLDDVDRMNTILAGTDPVLTDAWAAKLFGHEPESLGWLRMASDAGLGTIDTRANLPLEYSMM